MNLWRCCVVLVAILAAVAGTGLAGMGQEGCTVMVEPGESIQAAIDSAPEGAVICLASGEWEESLVIEKDLTMVGAGPDKTVIRGGNSESVIAIRSPGLKAVQVHLKGLGIFDGDKGVVVDAQATIQGCTVSGNKHGIELEGYAQATIQGCTVSGNWDGILLWDEAQATIEHCTVSGNDWFGIELHYKSQVTIQGCTVSENDDGILLWDKAQATIEHCTVSENWDDAIKILDEAQATIEHCTVSGNEVGIGLASYAQATIQGCTVSRNNWGICLFSHGVQVTIQGCTVSGNNWFGIELGGSAQVTIENNVVGKNGIAGVILYGSPCFADVVFPFAGYVTGKGNIIRDNGTDVCPQELGFLATEEGGTLDRRE